MNAQDFSSLQEAYIEVVEKQQLDELSVNKMNTYINKAEKDRDKLNKKWDQGTATPKERKKVFDREEGEARAEKKIKQKTGKDSFRLNALDKLKSAITKEEVDLYDIILSHLLDEGYAETEQNALKIMENMSESWSEEIITELNRLEREQGKESGGNPDKAYQHVKKMIRGMEGKPPGQRKKQRGGATPGPNTTPAQKVAKRRAAAQQSQDNMSSRFD